MKIDRVEVTNFRCIDDLTLDLDEINVLVGANSTGKSSLLHALVWFFEGGPLELEDIGGGGNHELSKEDQTIAVAVTFNSFSSADREVFGSYVINDEMTLWRKWSPGTDDKLTGRGLAFPPFNTIRAKPKAGEKNAEYKRLRSSNPELDLPSTRSAAQVDQALDEWEKAHPEKLVATEVEATHLFGFVGGAKLRGRFDCVLVPATSDPEAQATDAPRTLLRQLVERAGTSVQLKERLKGLEETILTEVQGILDEEGSEALDELSTRVTSELDRLIPGGIVKLESRPPTFQIPAPSVELRVSDGGVETSIGRQGHGFQRALLIALIQQLAVPRGRESPPSLFLAIEEPELYQHPLQARHFATTLEKLTQDGSGSIQIAYATHSEHFVDASHFERLRRFRKEKRDRDWPTAIVTRATFQRVAERLNGIYDPDQIMLRVRLTLRRQLAEAVFARVVVLVEGVTDAAVLHGLADKAGGLDAVGVAVVAARGKSQLALPWAILEELGVPTYVIFDSDAGVRKRCLKDGKSTEEAEQAAMQATQENRRLLRLLGAVAEDHPETRIERHYAVMHDRLEEELAQWPEFCSRRDDLLAETGDWRKKSDDVYRQAAAEAQTSPPDKLRRLCRRVLELPNSV